MKSLKNLYDKDLLNHLSKLVKKEHDLTLEILGHLIEVERRKIYRRLGYSSMYAYCTGGLGYSESSASRQKSVEQKEPSRYISQTIREAVYRRDGGRCAYIGSNGRRCNSKWDLEVHHDKTPFALGGDNSSANLKLVCAAHNRLESE